MLRDWYKPKKPLKLLTRITKNSHPEKKYDAIVVGAGPAGASAAYFMAKQGLDVLLLERGSYPGSKNCGGASIIAEHTHKLFPNFWDEFECERIVTQQAYWLMTEDSILSSSFTSMKLASAPYNHFTVKRRNFYKWLCDKAVNEGTTLRFDHHVTEVILDSGQAIGIQLSAPHNIQLLADVIILADGANSLVGERSGLVPKVSPKDLALYVKETIALPAQAIEDRFNLPPGFGSLIGLIGYPTAGFNGTGSIHTFKESININVGMSVADFAKAGIRPYELLDRIKKHPLIKPLLAGGVTLEYGSSVIPEGGYNAMPELVHPGLLIIGDAASLVNGTHGFNLAMWSGYFAAQAAYQAKINRDFSKKTLSLYYTLLKESFVLQDLKANAKMADLQRNVPYLFDLYSRIANETAYHITKVYNMPKRAKRLFIFKKITSIQPLTKIFKDAWKVIKVIR
ncbi:FAD-dependent oxidoreductase [Dendrosporobacter sp. 1207_IL3150]|uniref:FAD-dependent oxidoreductase n=1 Tax=Dendrosporobacter sp. 1207_IL3150 TaxID=3084054 RepID=UPI002FD9AE43